MTAKMKLRPIIGVMGSGSESYDERARLLGHWIAAQGWHLLCGGGAGVMASVSKAFCEVSPRKGLCIGILPGLADENGYAPVRGYPNPYIELCIKTHLPLSGTRGTKRESRNHINILSSDVIIALPGSHGTASEVRLAIRYNKPVVGYLNSLNEIEGLREKIDFENDFEKLTAKVAEKLNFSA